MVPSAAWLNVGKKIEYPLSTSLSGWVSERHMEALECCVKVLWLKALGSSHIQMSGGGLLSQRARTQEHRSPKAWQRPCSSWMVFFLLSGS